jgi:hypothetical protein
MAFCMMLYIPSRYTHRSEINASAVSSKLPSSFRFFLARMPVMYSFDALSSIQEWMTHTGLLSDTTRNHNGDDAEHLTP